MHRYIPHNQCNCHGGIDRDDTDATAATTVTIAIGNIFVPFEEKRTSSGTSLCLLLVLFYLCTTREVRKLVGRDFWRVHDFIHESGLISSAVNTLPFAILLLVF